MDRMGLRSDGRGYDLQMPGFGVMAHAIRGHNPRAAGCQTSSPSTKISFHNSRSTSRCLDVRWIKLRRRLIDHGGK